MIFKKIKYKLNEVKLLNMKFCCVYDKQNEKPFFYERLKSNKILLKTGKKPKRKESEIVFNTEQNSHEREFF